MSQMQNKKKKIKKMAFFISLILKITLKKQIFFDFCEIIYKWTVKSTPRVCFMLEHNCQAYGLNDCI